MEEKIEYVGANSLSSTDKDTATDASFILFDASKEEHLIDKESKKPKSSQGGNPKIEKSELGRRVARNQREVCSEERRPGGHRESTDD